VRNEEECVCSVCLFRCNIFIDFRIIKEMPGLVGSGTPYRNVSFVTETPREGIVSTVMNLATLKMD